LVAFLLLLVVSNGVRLLVTQNSDGGVLVLGWVCSRLGGGGLVGEADATIRRDVE
jgi:hypothetical protein